MEWSFDARSGRPTWVPFQEKEAQASLEGSFRWTDGRSMRAMETTPAASEMSDAPRSELRLSQTPRMVPAPFSVSN